MEDYDAYASQLIAKCFETVAKEETCSDSFETLLQNGVNKIKKRRGTAWVVQPILAEAEQLEVTAHEMIVECFDSISITDIENDDTARKF